MGKKLERGVSAAIRKAERGAAKSWDGIPPNGLPTKGIPMKGLSTKGLSTKGLSTNSLPLKVIEPNGPGSNRNARSRILEQGGGSLDDADLLALVLGRRTGIRSARDLARQILSTTGGLRGFSNRSAKEMMALFGVGPAQAARLKAVVTLSQRLGERRLSPGMPVKSSRAVFDHFHLRLRDAKREIFLVLLLDSKHRVIREERVSEGSLTASIVHPREVFQAAISELAGAIVAIHNHPSGDPTPSAEDFEITRRLKDAGELLGIHLLDHVILGDGEFVSFREHRLLEW